MPEENDKAGAADNEAGKQQEEAKAANGADKTDAAKTDAAKKEEGKKNEAKPSGNAGSSDPTENV